MTDYDKLAQRIVALGVGEYRGEGRYLIAPKTDHVREHGVAKWFCNDWRVVGALMEKIPRASGDNPLLLVLCRAITSSEENLSIAIAEACCDALEVTDE